MYAFFDPWTWWNRSSAYNLWIGCADWALGLCVCRVSYPARVTSRLLYTLILFLTLLIVLLLIFKFKIWLEDFYTSNSYIVDSGCMHYHDFTFTLSVTTLCYFPPFKHMILARLSLGTICFLSCSVYELACECCYVSIFLEPVPVVVTGVGWFV